MNTAMDIAVMGTATTIIIVHGGMTHGIMTGDGEIHGIKTGILEVEVPEDVDKRFSLDLRLFLLELKRFHINEKKPPVLPKGLVFSRFYSAFVSFPQPDTIEATVAIT